MISRMGVLLTVFDWSFYSNSTDHSAHSTEHSTTILLPFCGSFFHSILLVYLVILLPSTDCTPILLMILSPFYWQFCSHFTDYSIGCVLYTLLVGKQPFETEPRSLHWVERFLLPCSLYSLDLSLCPFYWSFYSHSVLLPLYWVFYCQSTGESTHILVLIFPFYW